MTKEADKLLQKNFGLENEELEEILSLQNIMDTSSPSFS